MRIEFNPLDAVERSAISRLIAIIEGDKASAPTALIASDAEVAEIRKEKASKARRAVDDARGATAEQCAAREIPGIKTNKVEKVINPPVVATSQAPADLKPSPETGLVEAQPLPPGCVQESILDAMQPPEVKADPAPAPAPPKVEEKPADKPASVEDLRNALVELATRAAQRKDFEAMSPEDKVKAGKDVARKILAEVGKSASVSSVPENLRAAVIAAAKAA